MKTIDLYLHNSEEKLNVCELVKVPQILKAQTEPCYRSAYFSEDGKNNCYGPLTLTFAIRTAKDLLLEGCDYQDVEIKIESAGRILPAIPGQSELLKLLEASDTLIRVNSKVYKPNSEVYGFQQVYDDVAKVMDKLKLMGFSNETMAIYATPEDITLEVHPSAIGLDESPELQNTHYKFLCYLADIKEIGGKPQKSFIKTILLDSVFKDHKVLLPGSFHPVLKRNKIGIGASHFSYGIAAFSDDCSKKRDAHECFQEAMNWVAFLEKKLAPVQGVKELLNSLHIIAFPDKNKTGAAVTSSVNSATVLATLAPVTAKSFIGVFQPLKAEIEAEANHFKELTQGIPAFCPGLDKALGKGWATGGLHLVLGNRESGKATMLLQQALLSENKMPVLCISYEQNLKGFVTNAACLTGGINKSEMMASLNNSTATASQTKLAFGAAIDRMQMRLSQNLFFSGVEAGRINFDADEILQFAAMLPDAPRKLILVDSLTEEDFGGNINGQLQKLKAVALAGNITIIMTIHTNTAPSKRPNFIEGSDIDYLAKYQRFSDTIIELSTEKTNLRKFVALIKGQVDPALVGNLEQKALQLSGGKKLKTDSYSLMRLIHNRNGKREMLLCLYQADMGRFFDLASVTLNHN